MAQPVGIARIPVQGHVPAAPASKPEDGRGSPARGWLLNPPQRNEIEYVSHAWRKGNVDVFPSNEEPNSTN